MKTEQMPSNESSALSPPLKWAGGKRWQVPYVEPLWQSAAAERLVEPFCGGLAIGLALEPSRGLANDRNEHLINFYSWVQRGLEIEIPMRNEEELYYRHRERFNELISHGKSNSMESASLFYFLNRTCFNGLCRFNKKGLFNVPFGKYKTINYLTTFQEYETYLGSWHFTSGDFAELQLEVDDFVYADPPYDVEFTSYSAGGFSWKDQVRTATWLAEHAGPVVLVNQATERIIELYRELGYDVSLLDAPRRISRTGDRTPAKEVFAVRNLNLPDPKRA